MLAKLIARFAHEVVTAYRHLDDAHQEPDGEPAEVRHEISCAAASTDLAVQWDHTTEPVTAQIGFGLPSRP